VPQFFSISSAVSPPQPALQFGTDRQNFSICCLDSKKNADMRAYMRTTVTIDPDTEHLLREHAARTGNSFKEVLNQAIRSALGRQVPGQDFRVEPLFAAPFPSDIAGRSMNRLADEWDDEETIRELAR
jgi:hypothetical protein